MPSKHLNIHLRQIFALLASRDTILIKILLLYAYNNNVRMRSCFRLLTRVIVSYQEVKLCALNQLYC